MSHQKLKHGSLSRVLGNFFLKYSFLLFISSLAGHLIYDVFANSLFDFEGIWGALFFALVVPSLTVLYFWDKFQDVFTLLSNDKIEVPQNLNGAKISVPYPSFQFEDLVAKLEASGMLITYLDRDQGIVKVREKMNFFNKCAGILYFDREKEELTIISFSFNNREERLTKFNDELYRLIGLPKGKR